MSDAPKSADAAAPKSKSKSKLIVIGAVVALLAAGGGGGYWWWSHRAAPVEGEAAHEEAAEKVPAGIVSFEPFVANLADEGGSRFLRTSLKLLVDNEERAKEIEESAVEKARVQSAVLEVLTEQTADDLITPEGKAALKEEITEKAQAVLEETKVTDVLFTEFVVQF